MGDWPELAQSIIKDARELNLEWLLKVKHAASIDATTAALIYHVDKDTISLISRLSICEIKQLAAIPGSLFQQRFEQAHLSKLLVGGNHQAAAVAMTNGAIHG